MLTTKVELVEVAEKETLGEVEQGIKEIEALKKEVVNPSVQSSLDEGIEQAKKAVHESKKDLHE